MSIHKGSRPSLTGYAIIALVAVIALLFGAWEASAQINPFGRICGERVEMTQFLQKRYKEMPRAVGVTSSGKSVMEIYTSEKGSWTVLMTNAKGVTCIMGAGHSWEEREKQAHLRPEAPI